MCEVVRIFYRGIDLGCQISALLRMLRLRNVFTYKLADS